MYHPSNPDCDYHEGHDFPTFIIIVLISGSYLLYALGLCSSSLCHDLKFVMLIQTKVLDTLIS